MSHPPVTSTWGINLRLGPDWFELPPGDDVDLDKLQALVDARIDRDPRLVPRRQQLVDMLAHFTRRANQRGAFCAALRWTLDELDGVSVATLYASAHRVEGRPVDQQIDGLRHGLTGRQGNQIVEPVLEVRELAVGRALRVQVMCETEPASSSGGQGDREETNPVVETVQYWLPVPSHDALLLVLFSTPNLAGGEALVAELDQMIEGSLEVVT